MKGYNRKGLYNGYDKKHKERDALDFYATPTEEVENILQTIPEFSDVEGTILEPCCGDGAMVEAIEVYCPNAYIIATDIHERETERYAFEHFSGEKYDFLSDDYPVNENIDYIIMNPPYSTIEPFVIRALEIAEKGVLMLGRLQFLEGKSRYENILKDNPPTDVWVYVDRIKCYKNGDTNLPGSSAQAYAWFYWNKENHDKDTKLHWIRRAS